MKRYSFDLHSTVSTHQCTCTNAKRVQHVSVVRTLTLVSVILLATAHVSHSWYDLNIDLNNCSSCGTLIIAVGDAFFQSQDTNFTVQDYVRISIGIRGVIICTAENMCLDMTLCTASQHLESVLFVKHAVDHVYVGRIFLILASAATLWLLKCTLATITYRLTDVAVVSGFLSFLGVILSCWTYVTFLEEFVNRRVTVFFPYGAVAATLASYMLFSCAYLVRKTRTRQESALLRQSWQYWKNKHNSVTFLV